MNLEAAVVNVSLFWILTAPHEYAHAWSATRLGDGTPRQQGRLTLNPLAHADWLGTVILPALTSLSGAGFIGWGKPVPTDPSQLRGGMRGLAVVALAGPATNILLAGVMALVASLAAQASPAVAELAVRGVFLSLYLALFNLLPVPPLDGSKVLLAARVPGKVYEGLARFGFLALIAALAVTPLGTWLVRASWEGTFVLLRLFG